VRQALRATAGDLEVVHRVVGAVAEPTAPEALFDIDAFLAAEGIEGSTEDLAFSDAGELYLGVPGGFVVADVEGGLQLLETSGDDVGRPLGIAFDADGNLWAADADRLALLKVSPEGVVTTALTTDGAQPLVGPNYVAVGRAGEVFLTDPCLGEVIAYDPASEEVAAVYSFDVPTQGGPNGVAVDASGDWLYVATENPALFCTIPGLVFNERVGGVYRIALTGDEAGTIEAVVEGVALFGDGLAFDDEGNLWVVLTNNAGLTLRESGVWVLPEGGSALQPYLALDDAIVANVAFGVSPFDETTLYMSMLAVPGFTREETRGLRSHAVGLSGLPLR
jgi:sugar lactone lactonase YvrE